jgi:hypothetical protein
VRDRRRTTTRPTYETNPFAKFAPIVIPPIRRAVQKMVEPRRVNFTGAPERVTRTVLGATAKSMLIVEPRDTTTGFPEAEIGAPHAVPQHHDDTASFT